MQKNLIIYLVGFPGAGKLTIARELSRLTGARVVDNHWINNPIFGLLDNDRVTPFPEEVWVQIEKVREAVLETVASISQPYASFIFTHAGIEEDIEDRRIFEKIKTTADRRNAAFVPVRLLCDEEELVHRISSAERAARLKSMDRHLARETVRTKTVLKPQHPNTLCLDVTSHSAESSARHIIEHVADRAAEFDG